jgi:prolipoprotein diacylglyceryl transferase
MLLTFVHDFNPVIFKLGPLTPRWYGFAYLCGFAAAFFLLKRLARKGMLRVPESKVADLVLNLCIFGVLLGGRLGYCIGYDPKLFTTIEWTEVFGINLPIWGVFAVWRGGMAAHGGVLFTILTLMYLARKHKFNLINLGDAACMVVALGLLFGRVANFINGELYGRPTDVAWAVKFPTEFTNATNNKFDPVEVGNYLIAHEPKAVVAWAKNNLFPQPIETIDDVNKLIEARKVDPAAVAKSMLAEGAQEKLDEINADKRFERFKEQVPSATNKNVMVTLDLNMPQVINLLQQGPADISESIRNKFASMPGLPPRHPSQLYQAFFEGALLFALVWIIGSKFKFDGMASGAFLTLYPVMRIIGEQFRVGDTPVTILGMTFSLGIWYSVLMILGGGAYWAYWIKKKRIAVWEPVAEPGKNDK